MENGAAGKPSERGTDWRRSALTAPPRVEDGFWVLFGLVMAALMPAALAVRAGAPPSSLARAAVAGVAWCGLFAGVVVAADRPPRAQGTVRRPLLLWAPVMVVGFVASTRLVGPAFVLVLGFAGTMTLTFVCRRAAAAEWVPATPRRRALAFAGAVAASAVLAAAALGEPGASAGLAPGRTDVTLVVVRHRPS